MADTATQSVLFAAEVRSKAGSAAARRLRRDGRVPGVIYGHGEESVSFSVTEEVVGQLMQADSKVVDFESNGKSEKALLKDVQWDTFGDRVLHLDLLRVSKGEMVEVEVPIELHGMSPGARAGNVLDHQLHALEVRCPALQIPSRFEVNINELELNDVVHVSDLDVPDHVEVLTPTEAIVVQVIEPMEVPEELEEEAAPVEPELVGREGDEDEEAEPEEPSED